MSTPVYCPRCGTLLDRRFTEGREREVCPACGFIFYRNPIPAVGVIVAFDGRVVLIRRRYEPCAGYWALPAGFMELGESAEESAARECHEETGLLVRIDHLLGVYSFIEGDRSGLVIIYAATAVGGELAAGDDATEVGVFAPDALPAPFAFRTHLQAIDRWRREGAPGVGALELPAAPGRMPQLRYAVRADLPFVLDLLLGDLQADSSVRLAADALLHDWLHDPDRPVLVAELDGSLAGVALLAFHQTLDGWRATLDDLVVAAALQRRGVGATLLDATARLAQARGCAALYVAPRPLTEGARAFLAACGLKTTLAFVLDLG